jgi:hypothetical protein
VTLGLSVTICLAGGAARLGAAGAWSAADCSGASGTSNGVAATSDEFYIGNVIVLPGLYLPTRERAAFALRTPDAELPACQRHYWKDLSASGGETLAVLQCYSATQAFGYMFDHPATMRAAPTIALSAPDSFQIFTGAGTGVVVTSTGGWRTSTTGFGSFGAGEIKVAGGLTPGNATVIAYRQIGAFISADARL